MSLPMTSKMKINKLEPSKHKKGRFLLHMEDGSILRVGENEIVSFSLYSGAELTDEQLAKLTDATRAGTLKSYAMNLLSVRSLSRRELVQKLLAKEATPSEADVIADRLTELGLLNDGEYARQVARHYAAKGYGEFKIKDELYRRGVPKEYWEDALPQAEDPADAIEALLRQKLKSATPDRKELKKVSDALARRGYRWNDISSALRRYGAELED